MIFYYIVIMVFILCVFTTMQLRINDLEQKLNEKVNTENFNHFFDAYRDQIDEIVNKFNNKIEVDQNNLIQTAKTFQTVKIVNDTLIQGLADGLEAIREIECRLPKSKKKSSKKSSKSVKRKTKSSVSKTTRKKGGSRSSRKKLVK